MEVCDDCKELFSYLQNRPRTIKYQWKSVPAIIQSAIACRFCEFIASVSGKYLDMSALEESLASINHGESLFIGQRIQPAVARAILSPKPLEVFARENVRGKISEVEFRVEDDGVRYDMNIGVWASTSGLVANSITSEEALTKDNIPQILERLSLWHAECIADCGNDGISECSRTISGAIIKEGHTVLPTRVLDIGTDPLNGQDIVVRLIETRGRRAAYTTLSHCWGPVDKRPLMTTSANLHNHLTGIRFDDLPLTFQDATEISWKLGVRYLWIDSLCIIQDANDDWLREAEQMGRIYENALVTIAASWASNASRGCFDTDTSLTTTLDLPYEIKDESPVILHFSSIYPGDWPPENAVLGRRAWALQESYMSRRMIFCAGGGYYWKCKTLKFNERRIDWMWRDNRRWANILQRYSRTKITYESDRLIALQGMANEIAKVRSDTYHFGIWSDDLPKILLWMRDGALGEEAGKAAHIKQTPEASSPDLERQGLLHLPTWTWASKPGSKVFWRKQTNFLNEEVTDWEESNIKIDSNGLLTLSAALQEVTASPVPALGRGAAMFSYFTQAFAPELVLLSTELAFLVHRMGESGGRAHYMHDAKGSKDVAIGLAAFDDGDSDLSSPILALAVCRTTRLPLDVFCRSITPKKDDELPVLVVLERSADDGIAHPISLSSARTQMQAPSGSHDLAVFIRKDHGYLPFGAGKTAMIDRNGVEWPSGSRGFEWIEDEYVASLLQEELHRAQSDSGDVRDPATAGRLLLANKVDDAMPYNGFGTCVHWVILLTPVKRVAGRYKRVGMGMVGQSNSWNDLPASNISII